MANFPTHSYPMQQSKLIRMLRALGGLEMKKLGDMVQSPYFNKQDDVIRLYDLLSDSHPKFKDVDVDRQTVFGTLFPDVVFDERKLRYVMSALTKLVEQFMVLRQLETRTVWYQHLLMENLQKHGLIEMMPTSIEQMRKDIEAYPFLDQDIYYARYLMQRDQYQYVATKRNVAVKENLEELIRNLDYYYIINKLKFSAELINHTNILAGTPESLFLEEIIQFVENTDLKREPAAEIYYLILKTLSHFEAEKHYHQLKAKLKENIGCFPQDELNDMYIFARNYCARQINSGNVGYLREVFELYQTLLESGIMLQGGELSQWDYKNIVSVGLRLEDFDWVERFIEEYRHRINSEEQENAYRYNKALYHYHLGAFGTTLELLRTVEFTDVYYHLDTKSLLVKTYYELEEYEALSSLMEAFYTYLRRNQLISDYNKDSYNNFLKMVKRLQRYRFKSSDKQAHLAGYLETLKPVANLSWLQKKLEGLG